MLHETLHALLLRAGLLEGRARRRHLQLDVPGVQFGEQRPFLHALPLRDGNVEDLPRHLESEVHGIVGGGHTGKILVDDACARGCRDLHGTHRLGSRGFAAARPGKQGDRQKR